MIRKTILKANFGWLVAFVVVLAVVVIASLQWRSLPSKGTTRSITIAQAGDFFLYAPLYVALDAGLFRDRQLDVRLVSTGGDEKTWAAVVGGSASFGVADPTFVAISDNRGRPGRIVANIVNGVPFWGITLRSDIPTIATAQALNSYTVATFPSPSTAFTLQTKMFMSAGLPSKIREGAFGSLIAMLKSGNADIALELEPSVSQAVKDGAKILYSMQEVYGDFAITGLATTPEVISGKSDVVRDAVCALQQALDYIHKQPDSALRILEKRFPDINAEVAKAAFSRVTEAGIIPKQIMTNSVAWEKAVALRVEAGDLSNPKPMSAYIDNSFAMFAIEQCRLN